MLVIDGKLGRFGGAVDTKIEGTGAISHVWRGVSARIVQVR